MNWHEFAAVALIHLLAVASPGPDFAIVVRHSLHYGKQAALATSVGIGVGILVHVAYSLIGISVVIATTPWLYDTIRYVAVAYLIYLAIGALRSKPVANNTVQPESGQSTVAISLIKAFSVGFITNGINPKATLFFLSLFTLVIHPDTPLVVKSIYGAYLACATGLWFCFLSFMLNHPAVLTFMQKYSYWVDRSMGALLILVAVTLLIN